MAATQKMDHVRADKGGLARRIPLWASAHSQLKAVQPVRKRIASRVRAVAQTEGPCNIIYKEVRGGGIQREAASAANPGGYKKKERQKPRHWKSVTEDGTETRV